MKKILCLLLCLTMISGCSKNKTIETLMIMTNPDEYTLYDAEGEKLSKMTYKSYEENYKRGYLVTNTEDKKAYIDYNGEVIVDFDEYDDVKYADEMVIGIKVKEAEETKEKSTVSSDVSFIINNEGDTILTTSDSKILKMSGLPIVNDNGTWKVLYKNGEELYSTNEEIKYAGYDDIYSMYYVGLENKVIVYYELDNELKTVEIETSGNFAVSDSNESGCLLLDKAQKVVLYVGYREGSQCVFTNIDVDSLYFDNSNNIFVKKGSTLSVLSVEAKKALKMNSYYKSSTDYIVRSNSIYGPHTAYVDGQVSASVENCQIFPTALKLDGNYFPAYVKDTGYQYYDLNGKQPFTTIFYDGEAFDNNNRAIVQDDVNSTFLINESGNSVISQKYFNIEYIGSSYYAVYNESGQFGIVNKDGKEILAVGYTALPEQCVFNYNGNEYIMVEKYGRTYVYNTSNDMEEVFSQEGNTVFNEKGYFIVNSESYYTFEGKLIH